VGNSPKDAIPTEKMMHDLTGNDPLEKASFIRATYVPQYRSSHGFIPAGK